MTLRLPHYSGAVLCGLVLACTADPIIADATTESSSTADLDSSAGPTTLDATSASSSSSTSDDASSSDGSESTGTPDPCATVLGSDPEPIFERPEGRFALRVSPGYDNLRGTVGTAPPLDFHHELEREGACRLLGFEASTCTPSCVQPAVCVDGACVTAPAFVSAGDVSLEGVGASSEMLSQTPYHEYFWETVSDPELDMPRLVGTGDGDVEAFELSVCPIAAPTPTDDWSALLEARADGESIVLEWSDPVDTARIYLRMTTGIGTHGGISPIEIECEGPDVGSLELPGAYLDVLYADGWACGECGGNDLIRYHADQTDNAGPTVQFRVDAFTWFWHIP